ncbi:hypothetical protein Salmuc_04127 [Salipiger mucosus DSM 16094]|uniref:Uncharacterized protein n=1 Tax=Salipiger mucosus DSM 16094 TaxID=1123237 RepID=S9QNE3_9RHOB|nr:hypothetical protein Salmuc_04127 [Salipiger mucosus DSM 16094]
MSRYSQPIRDVGGTARHVFMRGPAALPRPASGSARRLLQSQAWRHPTLLPSEEPRQQAKAHEEPRCFP